MFARLIYSLGAIAGGTAFSQFPEYYAHYLQRLGGRIDQARLRAAEIREDAAEKGLSVEAYVETFLDSAPHSLEGGRMAESIFQLERMEAAYQALRAATPLQRPLAFAEHMNPGLVEATLGDFAPAVPITPEGLSYAAAGVLAGLIAVFGAGRLLRRRRRKELKV
ncbi:MAG: hypothetical protein Kow00114_07680 [Kiloniellaceae bacterium]